MRTSLNEIKSIERYLQGNLDVAGKRAFEDRIDRDQSLRMHVFLQQKIYRLLPFYRRRRIKERAERIHHRLFNDPVHEAFRKTIFQYF